MMAEPFVQWRIGAFFKKVQDFVYKPEAFVYKPEEHEESWKDYPTPLKDIPVELVGKMFEGSEGPDEHKIFGTRGGIPRGFDVWRYERDDMNRRSFESMYQDMVASETDQMLEFKRNMLRNIEPSKSFILSDEFNQKEDEDQVRLLIDFYNDAQKKVGCYSHGDYTWSCPCSAPKWKNLGADVDDRVPCTKPKEGEEPDTTGSGRVIVIYKKKSEEMREAGELDCYVSPPQGRIWHHETSMRGSSSSHWEKPVGSIGCFLREPFAGRGFHYPIMWQSALVENSRLNLPRFQLFLP
jgi:hypothetical protein